MKKKKATSKKAAAKKTSPGKSVTKKRIAKRKPAPKRAEVKKDYTFFENVYDVARLVPKGRVTSYGAIAKYLGTAGSARMVGYAMNSCGTQVPPVPAHRVLNRNGMLTGKHHFGSPNAMQKMLEAEGVKVKKDKVVDWDNLFWDPAVDLGL